jgi:hypothetical protein
MITIPEPYVRWDMTQGFWVAGCDQCMWEDEPCYSMQEAQDAAWKHQHAGIPGHALMYASPATIHPFAGFLAKILIFSIVASVCIVLFAASILVLAFVLGILLL